LYDLPVVRISPEWVTSPEQGKSSDRIVTSSLLIHKSISNQTECYKFWNDRIRETRLEVHRGHLTILGVYGPREGREQLSTEFYETLQKIK
jgi:hypothetical protein